MLVVFVTVVVFVETVLVALVEGVGVVMEVVKEMVTIGFAMLTAVVVLRMVVVLVLTTHEEVFSVVRVLVEETIVVAVGAVMGFGEACAA